MKITFSKFTLVAIFAFALTFIFSCSEDSGKKCVEMFNPDNSFCYDGVVYDKCDGIKYNPYTHFCTGKTVARAICNGVDYNPLTQRCKNNIVQTKCGNAWYKEVKFCYDNVNNSFSDTLTDSRDGKTYKTVGIGAQIWMAENLNYKVTGSVCYDNLESNCKSYGRLYNWQAAMKACPDGWHLPSNDEWQDILDFAGGDDVVRSKFKAKSGWIGRSGTDDYGFSALPGGLGISISNGGFYDIGKSGFWWSSSSEYDATEAYRLCMSYFSDSEAADYCESSKTSLNSVRCLQD